MGTFATQNRYRIVFDQVFISVTNIILLNVGILPEVNGEITFCIQILEWSNFLTILFYKNKVR